MGRRLTFPMLLQKRFVLPVFHSLLIEHVAEDEVRLRVGKVSEHSTPSLFMAITCQSVGFGGFFRASIGF